MATTVAWIQECGEKPMFYLQSQWSPETHLLPVRSAWETSALNQSVSFVWRNAPRIGRDFGSALPFQTRLTQTKPILPQSNEHGSQVKDKGRRQCCHNKHKKFPYRPTRDVALLYGHASYITVHWTQRGCLTCKLDLHNNGFLPHFFQFIIHWYFCFFFSPGATTPHWGIVFYSPLEGFSLLAYEVSWSHTTTRHSQ